MAGMKRIAWLLVLVAAMASQCVLGQALVRMPFPRTQPVEPQPDKDGVYKMGPGMGIAKLVHGVEAVYPKDPDPANAKYVCALRVVVEPDGSAGAIEILNQHPSPFDDAAIAAVKASQFGPADYQGRPIPTRMTVWVPFVGGKGAVPVSGISGQKGATAPVARNEVEAEFPDQARKDKVGSGTVLIHVLVSEGGQLLETTVIWPAGHGFDENALKAVGKYHFKAATYQGVSVPMEITIEVNFQAL